MKKTYIKKMTGYKATNANMTCNGYQYKLGQWHEFDGELEMCKSGFHFCVYPSGPWAYYRDDNTRIFEVEAENILVVPRMPGADEKMVCRKIRLIREVTPGYQNTGDQNTGHQNTGHQNTGDRNTGYQNTGDLNTGYQNTGDRNTGYQNTGDQNTGNQNTGYGNATNASSGFFCVKEPTVICFDCDTGMLRDKFLNIHGRKAQALLEKLQDESPPDFEDFRCLPGISPEKLENLHRLHRNGRATAASKEK